MGVWGGCGRKMLEHDGDKTDIQERIELEYICFWTLTF